MPHLSPQSAVLISKTIFIFWLWTPNVCSYMYTICYILLRWKVKQEGSFTIIVIFCGIFSTSWKFLRKIFIPQSVFHSFSSLFFESQYKDIIKARGLSRIFLQYHEENLYRISCIYYFFAGSGGILLGYILTSSCDGKFYGAQSFSCSFAQQLQLWRTQI